MRLPRRSGSPRLRQSLSRPALLAAALGLVAAPAAASVCQSLAQELPGAAWIRAADLSDASGPGPTRIAARAAAAPAPRHAAAPDPAGQVTIRFAGHATYLITTGEGLTIATDYSGWSGPVEIPDIVTMNHAHETHWTARPDPRIPHVFRGWNPEGGRAVHFKRIGDVLVRNVSTDIRGWGGGVEHDGNSIFIFEVGELCIGHLGHLHHELTPSHHAAIGRLDIVMAAVDGGTTIALPKMLGMLRRFRASVVLPMHYWSGSSLERFILGISEDYRVVRSAEREVTFTLRTLPMVPTVYVMPEG